MALQRSCGCSKLGSSFCCCRGVEQAEESRTQIAGQHFSCNQGAQGHLATSEMVAVLQSFQCGAGLSWGLILSGLLTLSDRGIDWNMCDCCDIMRGTLLYFSLMVFLKSECYQRCKWAKKLLQSCLLSEAAAGMLMSSGLLLAGGAESYWQSGRNSQGRNKSDEGPRRFDI